MATACRTSWTWTRTSARGGVPRLRESRTRTGNLCHSRHHCIHHTGNVFSYDADRYPTLDRHGEHVQRPRWDSNHYAVAGFHDREGRPTLPFGIPDEMPVPTPPVWRVLARRRVWPREFQRGDLFLRKGRISNWGHYPEYAEGTWLAA